MSFGVSVINFYQETVFFNSVIDEQKKQLPFVLYGERLLQWKSKAHTYIEHIAHGTQRLSQAEAQASEQERLAIDKLKSQLLFTQVRIQKHVNRIDMQLQQDKSLLWKFNMPNEIPNSSYVADAESLVGIESDCISLYEVTVYINLLIEGQKTRSINYVELLWWNVEFQSAKRNVIEAIEQIPRFGPEVSESRKAIVALLKAQLVFTLSRIEKHIMRINGRIIDRHLKA